jgi:outer membrane biosynthesis protein TonB
MTNFLDAQETVDRFGVYIQELRAILKANSLKFGSPDNFFAFARRLQSDDLLRADLSRMVKFLIERESSTVSLKTILTIIAIASGGSALAETNRDLSKPVNVVTDFLIRSGKFAAADPDYLDDTSPFTASTNIAEEEAISSFPTDLPATNGLGDQSDNTIPRAASSDNLATVDRPSDLFQSLAHLEFTVHESKLYLDSIEQRIGKIDPRLDIPSLVSPAQNQSPAPNLEHLHRKDPLVEPPSPTLIHRASIQSKKHMASFFLFTEKLAIVPVLATIAGGTLLYISYPRISPKTEISPSIPTPTATINLVPATEDVKSATPLTVTATATATDDKPKKPSAGTLKTNALDSRPLKNFPKRTAKPIDPSPESSATPSFPQSNGEAEEAPPMQDSTKVRRDVGYPLAHLPPKSASSLRTINVTSGVMAANLVSASPPSYPKLASLTHMQGKVVMQAIISKDGTVQNLQVIQGHRLLRGAAKNSAKTWRYRPYLVNGKPVEVATIVSVDFALAH